MIYVKGFSDGSAIPNPGPGGWGVFLIIDNGYVEMYSSKSGRSAFTTNNEMELTGMLEILKMVPTKMPHINLVIASDSRYVLGGIIGNKLTETLKPSDLRRIPGWLGYWEKNGWKTKTGDVKNLELWKKIKQEIYNIVENNIEITFKWVQGHSGDKGNEMADTLSRKK